MLSRTRVLAFAVIPRLLIPEPSLRGWRRSTSPRQSAFTRKFTRLLAALLASAALAVWVPAASAQVGMTTQHNDVLRTGLQLDTHLTTANVSNQFSKLFTRVLPDGPHPSPGLKQRIYAQPLVDTLPSGKSIVIVATDYNMVYAFDATDPAAGAPLWTADLGPQEVSANGDWADANCNKSLPAAGVLGTPVIEWHALNIPNKKLFSAHALYVVSKNRAQVGDIKSPAVSFKIHKLDVATGAEIASSPLPQNALAGFDPYHQMQRPGLVFVDQPNAAGGGFVYAAFAAHCDAGPFHGWVIGFDGNLSQQVAAFNASPDGGGAGIWQGGQAPIWFRSQKDETDYLILSTGNDGSNKAKLSESVLKLKVGANGNLSVAHSFTPYNQTFLNSCDGDLAAAGPTMLRDLRHVVTGGKQGVLYVLDVLQLGHGQAAENPPLPTDCVDPAYGTIGPSYNGLTWKSTGDAVVQEFAAAKGHLHGAPVAATGKDLKRRIYIWSEEDHLKAFTQLASGKLDTTPLVNQSVPVVSGMPGGILSLSSKPGNGGDVIVWATHPLADAFLPTGPVQGVLYAFDGADVTKLLWSSAMSPGDALGEYPKFTPPTIANGHVYAATFEGKLEVYGLLAKPKGRLPGPK